MIKEQQRIESVVGTLYLVATETRLCGIFWDRQPVPLGTNAVLQKASQQLQEYFEGKRKNFDLPLELHGTPFQLKVWEELQRIPYGQTISYQQLAARVQNAKACRAVGTANGKNPISIMVPCHRVISADGTLGGYGGGLSAKVKLLVREGITLHPKSISQYATGL